MAIQGQGNSWQTAMLQAIGAPTTPNNVAKMNAWAQCEGGVPYNNPFFTTRNCCGGVSINSVGVKRYPTMADGIEANRQAILLPYYVAIVANLRSDGSQSAFASAVGASPWGTSGSCIASVLKTGPTAPPTTSTLIFSYAQLQCLWTTAGGSQQYQAMAAAIAMAESGGKSQATHTNTNGSIDRGLWQINSTNGAGSTLDIMGNARTAIAMSNNGANWRPWCTAYADGACGTRGGAYLGVGAPYQKFLNPNIQPDCNFSINGTNAAAGQGGDAQTLAASCSATDWLNPLTTQMCFDHAILGKGGLAKGIVDFLVGNILNTLIQDIIGIQAIGAGLVLMAFGIYLTINQTQTGKAVTAPIRFGARVAGTAAAPELLGATGGERTAARVQRTARMNIGARQQRAEFAARQRGRPTVSATEARTTGPPGARTTQRITVKRTLNDEANGYRQ